MKTAYSLFTFVAVAVDCSLPYPASTITSRSTRKLEREGGSILRTRRSMFVSFSLLVIFCLSASPGIAKPKHKKRNAISEFSLDKSVKQSDGILVRRNLEKLLSSPNVKLFLEVIKKAEGGQANLMVGGCRARSLTRHPATSLPRKCRFPIRFRGRKMFSTASGNYQLTLSNWKRIAPFLRLEDFSETSQALSALELVRRGGGAAEVSSRRGLAVKRRIQQGFVNLLQGKVKSALCLATYDWDSSSCSPLPAGAKISYAQLASSVRQTGSSPAKRRLARPRTRFGPAKRR